MYMTENPSKDALDKIETYANYDQGHNTNQNDQTDRGEQQGPAGRYFQLRDGLGLGIGKNLSCCRVSGIFAKQSYQSGIENLDWVHLGQLNPPCPA